jgi:hypothetical protein
MSNDVRTPSQTVEAMADNWPIVNALLGGTASMRAAGKKFLPQWPFESDQSYLSRLRTATIFPAFARTIDVLCGKPFSKPLTLGDDVPEKIRPWLDDVDLQGRNLHAFAASLCEAALSHGLAGILVDYPCADGLRTVAEEVSAGVRPYFVQLRVEDIIGWRVRVERGSSVLVQLRFVERITEYDGEFGEQIIEQVRVLYPGRWQVWREARTDRGEVEWQLHSEGATSLQKIPFVPVYGTRCGFMTGSPPLIELAHLNVEHWQSKSDQQSILHVARVPILFGRNLGDSPIVVGAGSAVTTDNAESDLKYVEHTGAAIEAGRRSILDLEDAMRQIGAELLVIKPGNTTVAQTVADNEPGMCALQRIVQDEEDALDAAMQLMAEWVGLPSGGHVQIYQDFGVATLAEASLELLRDMNLDGTFSDESLFAEAQRRGVIRPEIKWADEKLRIAQNSPKPGAVQLSD